MVFKTGYLKALENYVVSALPDTDIRAIPHINLKLQSWEKYCSSLSSMLSLTAIGWDDKRKMILIEEDQCWEDYVMKDPNARNMRNKRWPFNPDWIEIFGKDRANGNDAVDFPEVIRNASTSAAAEAFASQFGSQQERSNDCDEDSVVVSMPQHSGSNTSKKKSKNRKVSDSTFQVVEMTGQYCADASATLREVAQLIKSESIVTKLKNDVYAEMTKWKA